MDDDGSQQPTYIELVREEFSNEIIFAATILDTIVCSQAAPTRMAPSASPYLARFLSDFTLGFSDGLAVPFALTAGLSSLGQADTIICAGLAELCAGSISMGIGGYLSASDEVPAPGTHEDDLSSCGDEEEESRWMLRDGIPRGSSSSTWSDAAEEKEQERESSEEMIRSHLEPLALPDSTVREILAALGDCPAGVERAALRLRLRRQDASSSSSSSAAAAETPAYEEVPMRMRAVASGLSISLGYVVGGIIPLFPYFFASTVGRGLRWSIATCMVALMAFGAGKSWVLRGERRSLGRSLWEGVQMLILGSLAAGAAVLCVNLVGAKS
ncbi:hypothetical protein C2857_005292 [Epichloe festucae Fl1]|uniref:Vacuolar iron transporter Ccc1 n=1 Tax=Epichloe festucae (strain Fl1) TaxID=877507 RepID=A0A7S9KSN8_EPIFF|nr:hypothetical protein C2857_005292 [Epichloe festucae Fl1]